MSVEQITWIPVCERIPDPCRMVLVFDPKQLEPVWVGAYDDSIPGWQYAYGMDFFRPTHWAELPGGPTS